ALPLVAVRLTAAATASLGSGTTATCPGTRAAPARVSSRRVGSTGLNRAPRAAGVYAPETSTMTSVSANVRTHNRSRPSRATVAAPPLGRPAPEFQLHLAASGLPPPLA